MAWIRLCRPMSIQVSEQEHFLLENEPYPEYSTTRQIQEEQLNPQINLISFDGQPSVNEQNDSRMSVSRHPFPQQTFQGVEGYPAISPESGSNANKGAFPATLISSENFAPTNEHQNKSNHPDQPKSFVQPNLGNNSLRVNDYNSHQQHFLNKPSSAFVSPRGDYQKDLFSKNDPNQLDQGGKTTPFFHLKIFQEQIIAVEFPDPSPSPNLVNSAVFEPSQEKAEIAKRKYSRGDYLPNSQKSTEPKSYLSHRQRDGNSSNMSNFLFPMPDKPSRTTEAQKLQGKETLMEFVIDKKEPPRSRSESITQEVGDFVAADFLKDPLLTGSILSEKAVSRPISSRQILVDQNSKPKSVNELALQQNTEDNDKPIIEMTNKSTFQQKANLNGQPCPVSSIRSGRESLKNIPIIEDGDKWANKNPFTSREPSRDFKYMQSKSMVNAPQPQPLYSIGSTSTNEKIPFNNQVQRITRQPPQTFNLETNNGYSESRNYNQPYQPYNQTSNQQSIYSSYVAHQPSTKDSHTYNTSSQSHSRIASYEPPDSRQSVMPSNIQYRPSEPYSDNFSTGRPPQLSSQTYRDLLPQIPQQYPQPAYETSLGRSGASYHDLYANVSHTSNQPPRQSLAPNYLDSQSDRMAHNPPRQTVGSPAYHPINSAPPKPQGSFTHLHYDQQAQQHPQNQGYSSQQRPPASRNVTGGPLNLVSTPVYPGSSSTQLNLGLNYNQPRSQDYQVSNNIGQGYRLPQQSMQYIDNGQRNIRQFG